MFLLTRQSNLVRFEILVLSKVSLNILFAVDCGDFYYENVNIELRLSAEINVIWIATVYILMKYVNVMAIADAHV